MSKVTPSEYSMLRYFHEDKDDVSRWTEWEAFSLRNPEVRQAYDQMVNAQKIFGLVIKGLDVTEDDDT